MGRLSIAAVGSDSISGSFAEFSSQLGNVLDEPALGVDQVECGDRQRAATGVGGDFPFVGGYGSLQRAAGLPGSSGHLSRSAAGGLGEQMAGGGRDESSLLSAVGQFVADAVDHTGTGAEDLVHRWCVWR